MRQPGSSVWKITTYISEPIGKRWRDGKRKKPEEQLDDLVAGLIKAAVIRKAWERIRAEEERQLFAAGELARHLNVPESRVRTDKGGESITWCQAWKNTFASG